MTWIIRLYNFLGGVYFAIGLIVATALLVITGTFIEAKTGSHLNAAYFTYNNPLFEILLCFFFINILLASLRRWPFRLRHIPFLITHLGLLMVIGGTIIKNMQGTQGVLRMTEGGGSHQLLIPNTYAIHLEKRLQGKVIKTSLPFTKETFYKEVSTPFPELRMHGLSFSPHGKEVLETWIKGDNAIVAGFPPFPVHTWDLPPDTLPSPTHIELPEPWMVLAVRTNDILKTVQRLYLEGLDIEIALKKESNSAVKKPLNELLEAPIRFGEGQIEADFHLPYPSNESLHDAFLRLSWVDFATGFSEDIRLSLFGGDHLKVSNESHPFLSDTSFDVELKRKPLLLLIEDDHRDTFLFVFTSDGRILTKAFQPSQLKTFIAYDDGYQGYSIQAALDWKETPSEKEEKQRTLSAALKEALENNTPLIPPLSLFFHACWQAEENPTLLLPCFLDEWKKSLSPLFPDHSTLPPPLDKVMGHLDWSRVSLDEQKSCHWIVHLFDRLENPLKARKDLFTILKTKKWPFLEQLIPQKGDVRKLLSQLTQQLFRLADGLPEIDYSVSNEPAKQARLLSAFFKAYEIDYFLLDEVDVETPSTKNLTLEAPLTFLYEDVPPSSKLEENVPIITLNMTRGGKTEKITLQYQREGMGFKKPIFDGAYLVSFRPHYKAIPYHIRLRQARQINYPQSTQPYSYESDILVTKAGVPPIETTLSMNRVYESWDGYRFYLSSIAPEEPGAVKQIQIIVNHDPVKYLLTYPGALITALGIIALFWLKKIRSRA